MWRIFFFVLIDFSSLTSFGQVRFEPGFIVDNKGVRHECFIKNLEWRNNPAKFVYKLAPNSEIMVGTTDNIREFGLSNLKYERFTVKVDWSSNQTSKLNYQRNPEFVEETLFLLPLVKGDASLYLHYQYQARFFYIVNGSTIKPLIYKKFLMKANQVGENNTYLSQLNIELSCESITHSDLQNTNYKQDELVNYFVKFNTCKDPGYRHRVIKLTRRDFLSLNLRPGIGFNFLKMENTLFTQRNAKFSGDTGFRMGLEMEFILPWNNGKWGIILEPAFVSFKSKDKMLIFTATEEIEIEYKTIDVSIGLRHFFYLNKFSKLFLNASYVYSSPMNSKVIFERSLDLEIDGHGNFALGFGFNYRNRYNLEARYNTNRDILNNIFWNSDFSSFNLIAGYNFLKKK